MMDEELTAHAEKSDGYHGVIIRLNAGWRISICDTGIQWILQERTGTAKVLWRPRGYCRTSEAIRRLARQHAGKIDPEAQAALNRLPAWIEEVDHELDHQDAVDVDRVDGASLPSTTAPSQHRTRTARTRARTTPALPSEQVHRRGGSA
jgi:hypothetical protein